MGFDRLRGISLPKLSTRLKTSTTPPVHSATCLWLHRKHPDFFGLEVELLTSPQLGTSQCSHTSSGKEWLFPFTLSITADLELLVLVFSIYIVFLSLPCKAFRNTQEFAKITEYTVSRCGVCTDTQKPTGCSPDEPALIDPALKGRGVASNPKYSMTMTVFSGLSKSVSVSEQLLHLKHCISIWLFKIN